MSGRVALVTGAAGGIGAAVVEQLARLGVQVAAVDRDADALTVLVGQLAAQGLPVREFPADVSSSAEVDAVVAAVEQHLGPIDYLVNGAGVLRLGRAAELTDDDWAATFAVNTLGVFQVSRAVVGRMTARRRGAVVTVASNAAATPRTGMAAYAASKAAASMFTRCLGLEVARHGIRSNVVAPGSTETAMLTALWDSGAGPESSIAGIPGEFRTGIPLGKLAQPADIAAAVVFLLSDRAGHITLQELTVDGGASLGH
ncbi:2,3-dihydro-2,3-dihydroxybenzoate dehydrogenase [Streptacidiphilus sp. EB129]|uniref:2,3-dihydro-2,3-dihydroxybenzoate dehydrogenase n=1 Tax=Streptacidiphilus sp. EB129 TaxID=3156262 RepID=UPI003512CC9D